MVGDEEGIEALVDAQFAAWSAKDAAAYASTYAVDAKSFNPVGGVLDGREVIRLQHAFLFSGPFAQSTETEAITGIRFLTGTIAIAYLNSALSGHSGLPPGLNPTEPGVVRTTET